MPTTQKLKWLAGISCALGLALLAAGFRSPARSQSSTDSTTATAQVKRGDLVLTVGESGDIFASEAHEVLAAVRAPSSSVSSTASTTKILEIVEEGYQVTDQDIEDGRVLVQLDTTQIQERMIAHEIEFQNTLAIYIAAQEGLSIQLSANESQFRESRLLARFALLDFTKYLGSSAAEQILADCDLPFDEETMESYEGDIDRGAADRAELLAISSQEHVEVEERATAPEIEAPSAGPAMPEVAYDDLLNEGVLGTGEALQILRKLEDGLLLSRSELSLIEEDVAASRRLAEKDFITRSTLENDLVRLEKSQLALASAETELALFREYEFAKAVEQLLSDYVEALADLEREKREARSKLAEDEAQLRTATRRYELEVEERAEIEEQLASCTIRAEVPGLVAYGSTRIQGYYSSRYYEPIGEGAGVRYKQPIITIPDMSKLGATVDIHESYVKHIEIGQRCRITVDAEPDAVLEGEVTELAVLPDSNKSRYNPDIKVYPAEILIEGAHTWLKPGMSARIEIITGTLDDVLHIPVQAVFTEDGTHYCYVDGGDRPERRKVEIGQFTDEFIHITRGLREGESVLLSKPETSRDSDPGQDGVAVAGAEATGDI